MNKLLHTTGFALFLFAGMEVAAMGQSAEVFKLKNRSSFSTTGKDHDPFWPIGWVKPAAGSVSSGSPAEVEFSTEGFVLTSILMNQPSLAVINGKEYAEGDSIAYEAGGQKISIQVAAIHDGAVVLRHRDKNYIVQMHRKGEEQRQIAKTEDAPLH